MKAVTPSNDLPPIRSAALAKALSDPRVEGLARSLNLNLRDPATLSNLLARTRETIESSTQVTIGPEAAFGAPPAPMELVQTHTPYVHHALRTYHAIEAMK